MVVVESAELLQVSNSRSLERCCTEDTIKTCQDVIIDSRLLGTVASLTILNITLNFYGRVPPSGLVYKNALGDEAVISISNRSANVFGSFKTHQGKSYGIEKCHTKQVLKEFDVDKFVQEESVHHGSSGNLVPSSDNFIVERDNHTVVSYTVMFYYTTDFARVTADIAGYINQVQAFNFYR